MASVASGDNWVLDSDEALQKPRVAEAVSHLMRSEPSSKSKPGTHLPAEMVAEMMEMGSFHFVPGLEHLQLGTAKQPAVARLTHNRTTIGRGSRRGKQAKAKRHWRAGQAGSAGNETFHKLRRKRAGHVSARGLPNSVRTAKGRRKNGTAKKEKHEDNNSTDSHYVGASRTGGFQADPSSDELKATGQDWQSSLGDTRDDDWDGDDDDSDADADQSTSDNPSDDEDDAILPDSGDVEIGDDSIINITSTKDASAKTGGRPLKAADMSEPKGIPPEPDIMKLGEGIGAMAYERSPSGSRIVDHDLERRLELQDSATVIMLLVVFGITILLSCCSVYQVAEDLSPAAYYSEPRHYQQRVTCETADVDSFLTAFNLQPQNIRLRIVGKNLEPGGFRQLFRSLNPHAIRPRGLAALLPQRQRRRLTVLFDISLDLTPFIAGEGRLNDENLVTLQKFLTSRNSLETVLLQKRVDWVHWEDVATNMRQKLRTLGFPGDVEVHFEAYDEILVYKNHKWSNFVRNRVTQALVVISMVGGIFWLPYVWVRQKKTVVETRFRISLDPARYWELVSEGLSAAEGFHSM